MSYSSATPQAGNQNNTPEAPLVWGPHGAIKFLTQVPSTPGTNISLHSTLGTAYTAPWAQPTQHPGHKHQPTREHSKVTV